MKYTLKIIPLLFLITSWSLKAPLQVISTPGHFEVGGNQFYTPTQYNDQIFVLAVSNLIFDMQGNSLQGDLTSGFTGLVGIYINPDLTNVSIINALVEDIDNIGIFVSPGCSNITINNTSLEDCGNSAITFGGDSLSPINNVTITNCETSQSATLISAQAAWSLQFCNNNTLNNNNLLQNGSTDVVIDGIQLNNCVQSLITNCSINNNIGSGVSGYHVLGSSASIFQNCFALDNNASFTASNGFLIDTSSIATTFENCIAQGNSTTGGSTIEARGFGVFNSTSCTLNNCLAQSNSSLMGAGTAMGLKAANCSLIDVNQCIFSDNMATGTGFGILFDTTSQINMKSSVCQNNTGSVASIGCLLNNCNSYSLLSNQFLFNSGAPFNRGLYVINGTKRIALNNVSFNNGATNVEQIDGLTSAETSDLDTSLNNLNTITSYWTNIRGF